MTKKRRRVPANPAPQPTPVQMRPVALPPELDSQIEALRDADPAMYRILQAIKYSADNSRAALQMMHQVVAVQTDAAARAGSAAGAEFAAQVAEKLNPALLQLGGEVDAAKESADKLEAVTPRIEAAIMWERGAKSVLALLAAVAVGAGAIAIAWWLHDPCMFDWRGEVANNDGVVFETCITRQK